MTTVAAWVTMMRQFLEELQLTFTEENFTVATTAFETLAMANPKKCVDLFVSTLSPHAQLLTARDETLFERDLHLPGSLNISRMWNSPGVSAATKNAIWSYLNTLFMLGTTVSAMPEEMLKSIESVAATYAEKIQTGQMSMADLASSLMQTMQGGSGGSGGGSGGGGPFLNLNL